MALCKLMTALMQHASHYNESTLHCVLTVCAVYFGLGSQLHDLFAQCLAYYKP